MASTLSIYKDLIWNISLLYKVRCIFIPLHRTDCQLSSLAILDLLWLHGHSITIYC
jgi:Na+-translocating ferredoxin:NAD+ oxidoreductase RnfA subunit